ncbi:MAG: ATP synthase F1 subunit delta [Longimicrobiales bacterium]
MRDATVARSYGEALFELGERQEVQDAFAQAAAEMDVLLDASAIRRFLASPQIDAGEKKQALRKALEGRVPPLFLNFMLVVVDKRRQRLLADILREYHALLDERLGRVHVQITLAREPDERQEEEVGGALSRLLGRTVVPHIRVDDRIIGGIIARYGDRVLDGSLRRRLQELRRRMMEAELPSTELVSP